jgi:predicted nucleotidyltransferase
VDHGGTHEVGGLHVRLPQVEDLLVMKAIAHRPKDLQDVEGLLDVHPSVNIDTVREQVRDFANAVSMSDLIEDFEKMLERHQAKQHRRPAPK